MTFAGGMTAGLGTLYQLFYNGLQTGRGGDGVCAGADGAGLVEFYGVARSAGVAKHFHRGRGRTAAGNGDAVSRNLFAAGFYLGGPRRNAIRLLAGTVPLLVIAGTLEGFSVAVGSAGGCEISDGRGVVAGVGILADVSGHRPGSQPDSAYAPAGGCSEEPV